MGTTSVPNGYHGCTKWVPRVYQMGSRETQWSREALLGALELCVCVFEGAHQMASASLLRVWSLHHHHRSAGTTLDFEQKTNKWPEFLHAHYQCGRCARNSSQFLRNSAAIPRNSSATSPQFLAIPRQFLRNSFAFPPQFLRCSSQFSCNSHAFPPQFRRSSSQFLRNSSAFPSQFPSKSFGILNSFI